MSKINGHAQLYFNGKKLTYELSALIIVEDSSYAMCSLTMCINHGHNNQHDLHFWDNEDYLIETLFEKVLRPWVEEKTIKDVDAFKEVLSEEGISLDDFQGLYDLFVQAISRDFFYEYFKNKE